MVLALAIKADIFEEDLLDLHRNCPTQTLPFTLTIKESAKSKPVWLGYTRKGPWTASSCQKMFKKIANTMGWKSMLHYFHYSTGELTMMQDTTPRSLRYVYAGEMAGKIPDVCLEYPLPLHTKQRLIGTPQISDGP